MSRFSSAAIFSVMVWFGILVSCAELAAQEQTKVVVGEEKNFGADSDPKPILAIFKAKNDEFKGVAEDKRTESQRDFLSQYDALDGALNSLKTLLKTIDKAGGAAKNFTNELDRANEQLAQARRNLENPSPLSDGTADKVTKLEADNGDNEQALVTATQELAASVERVDFREERFRQSAKLVETLTATDQEIQGKLAQADLGSAEKLRIRLTLLHNEIRKRRIELERSHHVKLLAIDKGRRDLDAVQLDLAKVRRDLGIARLKIARELLDSKLKENQRLAEKEAREKRAEAAQKKSPLNISLLKREAILEELKAQQNSEKQRASRVKAALGNITRLIESIKTQSANIGKLLPEDQDLDPFKESYLKLQLQLIRQDLDRQEKKIATKVGEIAAIQKNLELERFHLQAFLDQEENREHNSPLFLAGDGVSSKIQEQYTEWQKLKRDWNRALDVHAATDRRSLVSSDQLFEYVEVENQLDDWKDRWQKASTEVRRIIRDRTDQLQKSSTATSEFLNLAPQPIKLLTQRRDRLAQLAFWLREDPPLSKTRLRELRQELVELWPTLGAILSRFKTWFVQEGLTGWRGVGALCALFCGIALAIFRRIKAKAPKRARAIAAMSRDPLFRLLILGLWITVEVGHYLLFCIGMALLGDKIIPEDPIAAAIFVSLVVAASRLGFIRLLNYLRESDDQLKPELLAQGRRFTNVASFGFLVIVPLVVFFEHTGARVTEQAARLLAAVWTLLVSFRLLTRRELLTLILPAREGSAMSKGIQSLFRYCWPFITAFAAVIVVLKTQGFQTASEDLALRSLRVILILATASVVYQILQAFIDSRTTTAVDNTDAGETTQFKILNRPEQARVETMRRILSLPLLVSVIAGTFFALSAALEIPASRWEAWEKIELVGGRTTPDGVVISGLAVGNVFVAILVIVLGWVLGRVIRDLVMVGNFGGDEVKRGIRYAVGTLAFYFIVSVSVIISLKNLNVSLADYGWLLGTAGVAIGFGMTEILSNFVSGLILFVERPVQVGDVVTIGDVEGDVRKISIRSTIVRTRDGVSIILPNRRLIEQDVVNWSHSDRKTRLKIDIGVAYGSDVPLVKKCLMQVADDESRVMKRPHSEVTFKQFGESELSFQLLCWLNTPDIGVHRRVRSDLNSAIDAIFRDNSIEIPFPQRDLHLKTTPETLTKLHETKEKDSEGETELELKED